MSQHLLAVDYLWILRLLLQRQIRTARSYFEQRSRTFEVTVEAEINSYHRTFVAVLGRNSPHDVQVLNFFWK